MHLDGCVEVEAAYYSLPPGWIGRFVKVQWDSCTCASCIRTRANFFVSISARNVVDIASRKKIAPRKCRSAQRNCCVVPNMREPPIGKFCQLIYQQQGEIGIRRILGVLSLMKKYGVAAVEDACATAIDIGIHEYRFVRRYLERRPHPQMFLRQIDPMIRQLTEYRDFIDLKTNLTSAVESQFFTFWADKSYRFNKSLLNAVNSDECM